MTETSIDTYRIIPIRDLVIGNWDLFGAWDLVIGI
jgi:hypothetical protein